MIDSITQDAFIGAFTPNEENDNEPEIIEKDFTLIYSRNKIYLKIKLELIRIKLEFILIKWK